MSNVLEATFQKGDFEPHTLSIEVEDVPGVLNQVSSATHAGCDPCNIFLLQPLPLNRSMSRGRRTAFPAVLPGRIALHTCTPARDRYSKAAIQKYPTTRNNAGHAQVTGVFARRGYNVQSLAVGNSEVEGQSRITMVIPGSADGTSKIIKQLNKLVHVQQVCGDLL